MTIALVYAGLCALILLALSLQVIRHRIRNRVSLGDGGHADLARMIRVQGNFVEYVPLALVMLLGLAMAGAAPWLLHLLGASLVIGRVLHAWGLTRHANTSFGRFAGTLLTWASLLGAALASLAFGFV